VRHEAAESTHRNFPIGWFPQSIRVRFRNSQDSSSPSTDRTPPSAHPTMSFGGSTGDIIVFAQQAWIIYKSCKGAPKDFQDISGEVSCLHIVLKETDELVAELGSELSAERRVHLEDLTAGCRSVLKDLEDLLQKFNSLGSHSKRTFDRLRWSQDRVSALRDRIVSHTVLLTAFNTNVQAYASPIH